MLGKEALFVLKNSSQFMAEKIEEPISHVLGCINGRIEIAVKRLHSCMIHVALIPVPCGTGIRTGIWDQVLDLRNK